jgi:predicted enzyme related to lactoylglutathione lyase
MVVRFDVALDCADLDRQAAFWSAALGYERVGADGQYVALGPPAGESGPRLLLQHVPEARVAKNRMHVDLLVADMYAEVARLGELGGRRLRDEPFDELGHRWVLMADPEGNEFCVCQQ